MGRGGRGSGGGGPLLTRASFILSVVWGLILVKVVTMQEMRKSLDCSQVQEERFDAGSCGRLVCFMTPCPCQGADRTPLPLHLTHCGNGQTAPCSRRAPEPEQCHIKSYTTRVCHLSILSACISPGSFTRRRGIP